MQGPQLRELHDQHEVLSFTDADHANDVRVIQLLHDARFPQHLILYRCVVIVVLQNLNSNNLLCPEFKVKTDQFRMLNIMSMKQGFRVISEILFMSSVHINGTIKSESPVGNSTLLQSMRKQIKPLSNHTTFPIMICGNNIFQTIPRRIFTEYLRLIRSCITV